MKRRNADCGKLRRPLKRGKIPDSFYGSLFMYMKFVLVWLLVLLADFILEFRFEYLWPFWLLVRSVYDSFKYQGLAFSVFFVCIALTSDMICFLFIPVHWLFFAASTYVWVQFVWHTERGICLPTVSLWLLFVYIEASIRLRELKNLPFHLDLCRPFASHCIGYPVVTLGFGFKSYVGYRMRQRKQKEVAKENEFYMQLIMQALPQEQQCTAVTTDKVIKGGEEVISNGVSPTSSSVSSSLSLTATTTTTTASNKRPPPLPPPPSTPAARDVSKFAELDPREAKKQQILGTSGNSALEKELEYMENELSRDKRSSVNDYDESADVDKDKSYKSNGVAPPHAVTTSTTTATTTTLATSATTTMMATTRSSPPSRAVTQQQASHHHHHQQPQQQQQQQHHHHQQQQHHHHHQQHHIKENKENVIALNSQQQPQQSSQRRGGSKNNAAIKDGNVNNFTNQKDDHTLRLEADIKRLKADLQASRQCELDLRSQLNTLATGERSVKNELIQFQQDNENLQAKLHGLVTARQHDKQSISSLEKKLQEERRFRSAAETQLNHERKLKKVEAEAASRAAAAAVVVANNVNSRQECTEICKARKRELDNDNKQLRRELKMCEDRVRQAEREVQALRQYKESHNEAEVLMSALSAMQDKNAHLENSLSAETRLKLDLFSALGDAKRQLEISQALLGQKCKEIDELKSRIAEVMAVMPSTTPFPPVSLDTSSMHRSTTNPNNHVHHAHFHHHHHHASKFVTDDTSGSLSSNLDPNASVYTPKNVVGGVSPVDEM